MAGYEQKRVRDHGGAMTVVRMFTPLFFHVLVVDMGATYGAEAAFANYHSMNFRRLIPLGGINTENLNNLRNVICDGFALLSEVKKKPAKIFSRLF